MIFNVTFSYFFTVVTILDTHENFKTPERLLLDEEFIIIKRVKLLFNSFLSPPTVIK